MHRKHLRLTLCLVFLGVEIGLGIGLQLTNGDTGDALRFAVVVLACLFFALFAGKRPSYLCTQLALVCTVCADYFLVLAPTQQQLPAMLFFSVTQLCYGLRLYLTEPRPRRTIHLWVQCTCAALAILLTVIVLGDKTDALALVSMFYYATLLCNLFFAIRGWRQAPLLALGLAFFLLCDTVVGLSSLDPYLSVPSALSAILSPGFDLVWAFYVPAQTLLALSEPVYNV